MTTVYPCGFIINVGNTKTPSLVQDFDGGWRLAAGEGGIREISVLSPQLCCEARTALKNKASFKTEQKTTGQSPAEVCLPEAILPETPQEVLFTPKQRSQGSSGWIPADNSTKNPFPGPSVVPRSLQDESIPHAPGRPLS